MEVMNVPLPLAEAIWREGIEPLRIDCRRAGVRMAQAFISVLVDPHGGSPPCRGHQRTNWPAPPAGHGPSDSVLRVKRHNAEPDMHA